MQIKRYRYILPWILVLTQYLNAQSQSIQLSGFVRDKNTQTPLSNVQLSVVGTQYGTVTDVKGRFSLGLRTVKPSAVVKIQHIAYEPINMKLSDFYRSITIDLSPRVIPLQGVRVEAEGTQVDIKQDLPQAIRILEARSFQNKGYADAADMLKTDHSIQVSESHTGRRQVSVRGGNPDETVILYNNIRLNRLYDSRFDLSLIDIDEMSRMEVIKGSNTILYGTGALAGVINIVPQFQKDYTLRFKQGVGSYDAGNWSMQAYRPIGPVDLSYTFKKGATHRMYEDSVEEPDYLENLATHHQANMAVRLDKEGDNQLRFSGLYTDYDYINDRLSEKLQMENTVIMGQWLGKLGRFGRFETNGAYSRQKELQSYSSMAFIPKRDIDSKSIQINVEKPVVWKRFEMILAYQFEDDEMDYSEIQRWTSMAVQRVPYVMNRTHHGAAAVTKYHAPTGYDYLSTFDCNVSFRRDWVKDTRVDDESILGTEWAPTWPDQRKHDKTTVKFSANLSGVRGDFLFNGYMNYGTAIKFPSLVQQVSQPQLSNNSSAEMYLKPEENRSTEIGIELTRQVDQQEIMGWQLNANFFKNYYNNKFRYYFIPGIPVAYYDNVRTASITGVEGSGRIFLFDKKMTIGGGFSKYFVSDKAAFPFKYDQKGVLDLIIEHAGWQGHLHYFAEGEQVGWVRMTGGSFGVIDLPGFSNFDVFVGKSFDFFNVKTQFTGSIRNILDTELTVAELPFRDRRFHLTFGIKY